MTSKLYPMRRLSLQFLLAATAGLVVMIFAPALGAQETVVQIDPAQTKIEFSLNGNVHTVHGKFNLKSSALRFDPSTGKIDGTIVVDATSGDSGNSGRDARMHREILESAKFPEIVFTPALMAGAVAAEGSSTLQVTGKFRLHGQDHDVTLPIEVRSDGKNLQIATHIDIPYVKWGLKNPSNFFLRVNDTVAIEIQAAGHLQSAGNP
jgi:polyisoprenoid-binding protein YceI